MACTKQGWIKRKANGSGFAWNKGRKFPEFSGDKSSRWKGGLTSLVCWECEGHFQVKPYRKETAHFCSKQCSYQYRDEGKRTSDKKIRQSWAYKAWRTLVFERDNYTCVHCGDKNKKGRGDSLKLHADHIKPFALYPELRFEPSNGRTLCVPCHKKTGTFGRGAVYRVKVASA
jgi:5-methylcytosine-specific restriction endonuclease McrA